MRLIDADAMKSFLCKCCNILRSEEPCEPSECNVWAVIDEQPTVDAAPVEYGRWKIVDSDSGDPGYYEAYLEVECSNCGLTVGVEQGQYGWIYGERFPWNYCPNCGAKMDHE